MQIPLSWLREFIETALSPAEMERAFTLAGIEVDRLQPAPLAFTGVVVGEVLECAPHPDAERLRLAKVSDGKEVFDVVCGAPNCRAGLKTALARVGALLEDERGEDFKVKPSKIRGALSQGMLCSAKELGLGPDYEGILELPAETPVGTDLIDLYGDYLLEVSLTPNLGHCFSVLGLSRELAAITDEAPKPSALAHPPEGDIRSHVSVSVEDVERCPRYSCMLIEGVQVGPSPDWLKRRLAHCGMRSINNVVDVTNFVTMELGQPLHAFDFDRVRGGHIRVRSLPGEALTLLDGSHHTFQDELLICDSQGPLAVAGVMGGAESEVSEKTCTVLLEAAYFDPVAIRQASRRLAIKSESAKRFERGTDPQMVLKALFRAAQLIEAVSGGRILPGYEDVHSDPFAPRTLICRVDRVNQLLGTKLSVGEIEGLFKRLRLTVSEEADGILGVTIPSYRADLTQEIDLVEEVARLYGFHNISRDTPPRYCVSTIPHTPLFLFEREIRLRLVALGLQEVVTNTLVSSYLESFVDPCAVPPESIVHILNPVSGDHAVLRPSLLPSLLSVVARNRRHGWNDLALFELGYVHTQQSNKYEEEAVAAIVLSGSREPSHWESGSSSFDFYDVKGTVQAILEGLQVRRWEVRPSHYKTFHPTAQALVCVGEQEVGTFGQIHPKLLRLSDIGEPLFFATLNLATLMHCAEQQQHLEALPQFPGSKRDWTLTVKESTSAGDVLKAIWSTPSRLLRGVEVVALYRSEQVGKDRKNVTFRMVYRDDRKTISYKTVDAEHQRIVANAEKQLGANARMEGFER